VYGALSRWASGYRETAKYLHLQQLRVFHATARGASAVLRDPTLLPAAGVYLARK